jgi:signal transduction protein with GAF and PtsI domain
MDNTFQVPLTPEQLAAINAGDGYARCEDPTTRIHYQLVQFEPSTLDDNYFREKLAEAEADVARGLVAEWDIEEVRREVQSRLDQHSKK